MIRFKYPIGKVYSYINLGVSSGIMISETDVIKRESKIDSNRNSEEIFIDPSKLEQGLLVGWGAKYNKLLLEVRLEKSNGISKIVALNSKVNRYFILLGYRF